LFRKSDICTQRNLTTNDTMSAHHAMFLREKVHGATFTLRTARNFSKKLCHTFISRHTLCQSVRMITIRRDYGIRWSCSRNRPSHNGFLTNVKVTKSADFLLTIQLTSYLLEFAHKQHRLIPLLVCFFCYRCLTHFEVLNFLTNPTTNLINYNDISTNISA